MTWIERNWRIAERLDREYPKVMIGERTYVYFAPGSGARHLLHLKRRSLVPPEGVVDASGR